MYETCGDPYVRRRLPRPERHHPCAAKALYQRFGDDVEIVGILNGYDGLIKGEWREMQQYEFSGILTVGGTILGPSAPPSK